MGTIALTPPGKALRVKDAVEHYFRETGRPLRDVERFTGKSQDWGRRMLREFWGNERAASGGVPNSQLLSVIPGQTVSVADLRTFQAELAGYNEIVRWPLYAYKAYAAAGSLLITLFDQSEGSATLGRLDTNMTGSGGILVGNEMQIVYGIRVDLLSAAADVQVINTTPAVAAGEKYKVLTNGWLEFIVSQKSYMIGAPLLLFPPGFGVGTFATATAVAATIANFSNAQSGVPSNEAVYKLAPPVGILPTRPFQVTLNWKALQTVTTACRIGCVLDGWKLRSVQ
jgi:hypothetical protein